MVEGILAILVAVWFYRTATSRGQDPFLWAAVGVGVYYLAVFLWVWFNKTSFMEGVHHQSVAVGVFIHYLGSVLGLVAAWLVRRYGLIKRVP